MRDKTALYITTPHESGHCDSPPGLSFPLSLLCCLVIDTFHIEEIDTCGDVTCAEPAAPSSDEFGAVDALTWINNMQQRIGVGKLGLPGALKIAQVPRL